MKEYSKEFVKAFEDYYKHKDEIDRRKLYLENKRASQDFDEYCKEHDEICSAEFVNQNSYGF